MWFLESPTKKQVRTTFSDSNFAESSWNARSYTRVSLNMWFLESPIKQQVRKTFSDSHVKIWTLFSRLLPESIPSRRVFPRNLRPLGPSLLLLSLIVDRICGKVSRNIGQLKHIDAYDPLPQKKYVWISTLSPNHHHNPYPNRCVHHDHPPPIPTPSLVSGGPSSPSTLFSPPPGYLVSLPFFKTRSHLLPSPYLLCRSSLPLLSAHEVSPALPIPPRSRGLVSSHWGNTSGQSLPVNIPDWLPSNARERTERDWVHRSCKFMTSLSVDRDCCAFTKLAKNTFSRNYKITNNRLLLCAKELVQNVSLRSQVSQSIMVVSARGFVVYLQTDAVQQIQTVPV